MANGYGPNRKRLDIFTAKAMQALIANPGCFSATKAEIAEAAALYAVATMAAADKKYAELVQADLDAATAAELALDAKANAEVDATEAPAS